MKTTQISATTPPGGDATDNPRLCLLNSHLAHCKPYKAFVACAEATDHTWASDEDIEAFEAHIARTLKWDVSLLDWGQLWLIAAQQVLDGRLRWATPVTEIDGTPIVDLPDSEGDYFPDEFPEGGVL